MEPPVAPLNNAVAPRNDDKVYWLMAAILGLVVAFVAYYVMGL